MASFDIVWTVHKWTCNRIPVYEWKRVWVEEYGEYRVQQVIVGYEWEDPEEIGEYPCTGINFILKSDNKSNFVEFNVLPAVDIFKGDIVSLRCNGVVPSGFKTGIVQDIYENSDGTRHISAYDPSVLLKNVKCKAYVDGIFKSKMLIRNPDLNGDYRTINNFVSDQLNEKFITSWATLQSYLPPVVVDNTATYAGGSISNPSNGFGESTVHPLDDSKVLPDLLVSDLSLYDAYYKFLNTICGFKVWYNGESEGSAKCRVDYGFVRLKIDELQTINGIGRYSNGILIDVDNEYISSTKCIESVKNDKVDEVIVYSNNNNLRGSYIDELIAYPTKTVAYKVEGNYSKEELDWIASRIYSDTNNIDKSYEITFPPGTIRFKDGEYFGGYVAGVGTFGIGDQTVSPVMPFKGGDDVDQRYDQSDSVWQIDEVNITEEGTYVTVGSSYLTIMEILGNKLVEVTGGTDPVIEDYDYDSGEITFDPGTHTNVLSKPLKLPGNSTGDVTIRTVVTQLSETNTTPIREEVIKQFSFQNDSFILKPYEETNITCGPMDGIPAKYNYADVHITWQVGCRSEDSSEAYCEELMKYTYADLYDLYDHITTSYNQLNSVATTNTCAQFTTIYNTFINTVDSEFHDGSDTLFGNIKDAMDYYSEFHYNLTTACTGLYWLRLYDYFADDPVRSLYCEDDMCDDVANLPCKELVGNNTLIIDLLDNIYSQIYTVASGYFCGTKCEDCTGIEINNDNPMSYDDRNACDICETLGTFQDDFLEFISEFTTLSNYISSRCGSIEYECGQCNDCLTNQPTWITTCESCVSACDSALTSALSDCDSLLVEEEIADCKRLAKSTHYSCIDDCTHHYRDCTKYAEKYKPSSCNTICDSPLNTCENLTNYYDDLIVLCQEFSEVIDDFMSFVDEVSVRKLLYYELYEWMDYFYNGTNDCDGDCNADCNSYDDAVAAGLAWLPDGTIKSDVITYFNNKTGVCGDPDVLCENYGVDDINNSFSVFVTTYYQNTLTSFCSANYDSLPILKTRFVSKKTEFYNGIINVSSSGQSYCEERIDDFDVIFDPEFILDRTHPSFPTWLSINETEMNLVSSDSSHTLIDNAEKYTTLSQDFGINAWTGALPIYNDGYLPRANLYLKVRNNSFYSSMYMDNLRVNIKFHYYSDAPFIASNTNYAELFVSDFVEEGTSYPIYVYTSNYSENILNILAYVVKHDTLTNTYYQDIIRFDTTPLVTMGDINIFKGSELLDEFSKYYYDRNKSDNRFFAKIITPTLISQDNTYLNIWVEPTTNPNDPDTEFKIHVANFPETDTEHNISIQSIHDNIDLIQFYNVISGDFDLTNYEDEVYGYATDVVLTIPRYAIEPVYYETLAQTYKDSASIIPYVETSSQNITDYPTITINDYESPFTIFNNGVLRFSDNLNNAPDGVKSKDVFKFGLNDININKIDLTTASKIKVRFLINYSVYKDVYSDTDEY